MAAGLALAGPSPQLALSSSRSAAALLLPRALRVRLWLQQSLLRLLLLRLLLLRLLLLRLLLLRLLLLRWRRQRTPLILY